MARKPKRDAVWSEIARELGGEIVAGKRGKLARVRFPADVWTVVLDEYTSSSGQHSTTYTRVRAFYRARDDFRFRVYRRTPFSGIGKMFGMQDFEVGMPDLDRDYIVQSNSQGKVQALLMPRDVARPLETLRSGRLEVRKVRRKGVTDASLRELVYQRQGVVRDPDTLRTMIGLVRAALKHLARLGAAAREPVSIEA